MLKSLLQQKSATSNLKSGQHNTDHHSETVNSLWLKQNSATKANNPGQTFVPENGTNIFFSAK